MKEKLKDTKNLEIKKEGITNLCKLTMERVRGYLKRLGLNKYYEHIPHIINKLNGLPPPILTRDVEEKFSGMINALSYGAPPHGGIAPGIDRIVMLLADEKNIREVTMFPMNQNAQDLMMNAPSTINDDQLKELNLIVKKKT